MYIHIPCDFQLLEQRQNRQMPSLQLAGVELELCSLG